MNENFKKFNATSLANTSFDESFGISNAQSISTPNNSQIANAQSCGTNATQGIDIKGTQSTNAQSITTQNTNTQSITTQNAEAKITDIKSLSIAQLTELCKDLRRQIIEVVSKNGGHLSSNLGAVELIVAMHYVFDAAADPFIFDVSHQAYAHKLLTGRAGQFATLRRFGGLSGFTKPEEGDYFVAGHAGTSISLLVGACKAIALKKQERTPIALIGDGAMSAGMVYEALNELGVLKLPCVIVLNDNEMSISKPIGAISKFLSGAMAGEFYQRFKARVGRVLVRLPKSATYMARRFEESLKLITPGILFEELGLDYIGPIDGHSLEELIAVLSKAKALRKPCIVHTQTIKGKGYAPAEAKEAKWHGISAFDISTGEVLKKGDLKASATELFAKNLLRLADKHENVVGVTAAMPSGTGLDKLIEKHPERFWDTAITEPHAVTSMAAMAREGFKPFIAIYSTFLQRAFDQIIHDCALMGLGVVFAMDRAGIVGEDGETHQGAFDVNFLSSIPNLTLCAPRDEVMMAEIMDFAYDFNAPLAFRYPRGSFILDGNTFNEFNGEKSRKIRLGKGQVLSKSPSEVAFIGYGQGVGTAKLVLDELAKMGHENYATLVDLIFAKPIDSELLADLASHTKLWFIFSPNAKIGGIASLVRQCLDTLDNAEVMENADFAKGGGTKNEDFLSQNINIVSFEFDDKFIPHGTQSEIQSHLGLSPKTLAKKVLKFAKCYC